MTAQLYDLGSYRAAMTDQKAPPAPPGMLTVPTQAWIAAHPRFLTDLAYYHAAMFAHHHALRCGLKADTPDYFAHVEYFTGDRELPQGSARPCDQIMHDGQKWLVWDVSRDMAPMIVKEGRKVLLGQGTWTRLADAVKKAISGIEEQGR